MNTTTGRPVEGMCPGVCWPVNDIVDLRYTQYVVQSSNKWWRFYLHSQFTSTPFKMWIPPQKRTNVHLSSIPATPVAHLPVSPTPWLAGGYSVNLRSEVSSSSTDRRMFWFSSRVPSPSSYQGFSEVELVDSRLGAYSLSSDGSDRTRLYICSAGRGEPVYHTGQSKPQPVYVEGKSLIAKCM